VSSKKEFIYHLEIALDLLDRAEGTTLYQIQKKAGGWSDKDYSKMLENMAVFVMQLKGYNEEI
jgi:hypothetical protein